jgi:23S rRNA pseudouridine955/2504/2580 synthase
VHEGDRIRVPPVRTARGHGVASAAPGDGGDVAAASAPPRSFDVLYEDELLLAVDKPAGVAVHGGSGVSFGLIEQLRRARPQARFLELVHRLDKETSGVILVAKKRSALTSLQDQFRARGTEKRYVALVAGRWPKNRKVIDLPLLRGLDAQGERFVRVDAAALRNPDTAATPDGKRAITLVTVLRHLDGCSLLDVTIKTGRTHQIRVHLAHEGMPVIGDPKYGDFALNRSYARGPLRFARMFLHAARLGFDHPGSGERIVLESPLPQACRALLEQLEGQIEGQIEGQAPAVVEPRR